MRFYSILLSSFMLLAACQESPSSEKKGNQPIGPLDATFIAHGTIDRWKSFRTLSFTYISENNDQRDTQRITTDLWDRRELIQGANADIGFDGKEYWKVMYDSSASKTDPTFMVNLQFYFFAMPFVLSDPGVQMTPMSPRQLNNRMYDVTKITFEDSVGVAPKDQYILYIDQATQELRYMLYSVTYFNPDNAEKYGALYYADWQTVEGLRLPQVVERFSWDADSQSLGAARGRKLFQRLTFSKDAKASAFFQKP